MKDILYERNPKEQLLTSQKGEATMKEKIETALADIRPSLQADGGDVELVDVENGIVRIRRV